MGADTPKHIRYKLAETVEDKTSAGLIIINLGSLITNLGSKCQDSKWKHRWQHLNNKC